MLRILLRSHYKAQEQAESFSIHARVSLQVERATRLRPFLLVPAVLRAWAACPHPPAPAPPFGSAFSSFGQLPFHERGTRKSDTKAPSPARNIEAATWRDVAWGCKSKLLLLAHKFSASQRKSCLGQAVGWLFFFKTITIGFFK